MKADMKSSHLQRWLTSIVAIPVLLYLILFGPRVLFYSLLCALSIVGIFEFNDTTDTSFPRPVRWALPLLSVAFFAVLYYRRILIMPFMLFLFALIPLAYFMITSPSKGPKGTSEIAIALFGPVYILLPLSMLVLVDMRPDGKTWIMFLVVVMFLSDSGAFYFGRSMGRHKLYEAVSPKKTWEGAFGGLFCSLLGGLIFMRIFRPGGFDSGLFILIPLLSIAGQLGDLAESMLKRNHSKKDSGRILPGHGGVLDRIDGFLFAIPMLYLYLDLAGY